MLAFNAGVVGERVSTRTWLARAAVRIGVRTMPFNFTEADLARFLRDLHVILNQAAMRLGQEDWTLDGQNFDDVIQQVMLEVARYMRGIARLKPFKKEHWNKPIRKPADLVLYSRRRLRTVYLSLKRNAQRDYARLVAYPDCVSSAVMADRSPEEHPIYNLEFLETILDELWLCDPLAYRYVVLVIKSHQLPGTKNLNACDNTLIAGLLQCTPAAVRNARKRIETWHDHYLADLQAQDQEVPLSRRQSRRPGGLVR